MKNIILVMLAMLATSSAFASESLICSVNTQTANPNNYDKVLFSGAIQSGESVYIKQNGEVLKLNTDEIKDVMALDKSKVISARISEDEINVSLGTWDASKLGTDTSMTPEKIDVFASKSSPISLISSKMYVYCFIEKK